ncbi:MAG TPA: hypothetical protein VFI72_03710 [Candidatus Angelobacter sp.]|nr:hypothetical protein [Candidatus Angelobacter sp.]
MSQVFNSEDAQALLFRLRGIMLPLQRWAAPIASVLTLVAGFCHSRPLRFLLISVAAILFLVVAADFARSLLDHETSWASHQGPPQQIPVDIGQLTLAALLAIFYTAMIFVGLHLVLLPTGLAFFIMLPGVVVLSSLAAWHNVRLWYREGADYEQAIKEEAQLSHKLRIPPLR